MDPSSRGKPIVQRTCVVAIGALVAAAYLYWQNQKVKLGDPTGLPPFHAAVTLDDRDLVKSLIATGADIQERATEGNSPLHYARSAEMVRILIDAGALIEEPNHEGEPPIHHVRMPDAIRALIAAGADPNQRDKGGESALHDAPGKAAVVALVKGGASVDLADHRKLTPLHSACNAGVVAALLKHGADPKLLDVRRRTPLHTLRDPKGVGALVKAGISPDAIDGVGYTPLIRAKEPAMVKALLRAGANPSGVPGRPDTIPLLYFRSRSVTGHREMALALLDAGADPDPIHARTGKTQLHTLLESQSHKRGDIELMIAFLERGAKLPPSPTWAKASDSRLLKALWRRGAHPGTFTLAGVDDLKLVKDIIAAGGAVSGGAGGHALGESANLEILIALFEAGAPPDQNRSGGTALATILQRHRQDRLPDGNIDDMVDYLLPRTDLTKADHLMATGSVRLTEKLLDAGADPNASELFHHVVTACKDSSDHDHRQLELLLKAGVDPNQLVGRNRNRHPLNVASPPAAALLAAFGAKTPAE